MKLAILDDYQRVALKSAGWDRLKKKQVEISVFHEAFDSVDDAAKKLIDTYALRVDIKLRDEVQERARKLDVASYMGLVMPKLEPVIDREGKITDVQVSYPQDFAKQMLEYSEFTRREQTKSADGRKGRNTP